MKKKLLLILAVLAVLSASGVWGYRWVTYEKLDLSKVLPYAQTEAVPKLIERIKSQPIGPEGFTFVALGDTRTNFAMAEKVVTAAAAEKPAFILANGDIVRRGRPEEYESHHLRLVDAIKPMPFITVPGNHEEGPNRDFEAFLAIYGQEQFSFDYGNARFVGLNNSGRLGVTWAHLRYLEQELSKPGVSHKFVVFHVPPRDMDIFVDSEEGRGFRWNAKAFRKLMSEQHVTAVFMGHVHGFAEQTLDGVRYIITGGAGANLAERLPEEGRVHNYVLVHVQPAAVKFEVVRLVGNEWVRGEF
ncbi:MAG: metallophosphoesterase [Candidatus Hydrogenedentes bacterium]|nr:metallophosphoesterase [Candidatus Hydrogenedentota bacterium]